MGVYQGLFKLESPFKVLEFENKNSRPLRALKVLNL
jgi:hypothetical protein